MSADLTGAASDGLNVDIAANNVNATATPGADQTERHDAFGTPSVTAIAMSDTIATGDMEAMAQTLSSGGTCYIAAHWNKV